MPHADARSERGAAAVFIYIPGVLDASGPPLGHIMSPEVETEQHELLRLREELADFFENGAMPLHWVGPTGTILRANRAELQLLGYESRDYIGHDIAEFCVDKATIDDLLCRLHAGEVVHAYPARLRCKDGSTRDVVIDSSVYREEGRFVHTRCFTRNVTDQLNTERELRSNQKRFELVARATQDLIWDWDVLGRTVSWSGDARELSSAGPGGVPQLMEDYRTWAARVHPEDLAIAEAISRAAFDGGAESWEHEYRFRRADGSWADMVERAFIVRDPAGTPIRVVGAMRDVTGRKAAEQATTRLAAIVRSARDAIVGKTLDGIVTSWNAAAERIFGYAEHEMVGQSVFILIPEDLHGDERDLLARVRRGEPLEYLETERIRKDGSRISISLSVSPIWDHSGTIVGAASIKRDITETKRAAEELARREERYRALVTATTSIVWKADAFGGFVEPQALWEQFTGQPWEEHRGLGWLKAVHADDRRELEADWNRAREAARVFEGRGRVWRQGHRDYRHFISRAAPVLGTDGVVREWIGTLTDVENQWAAEQRLRQAERMESVGRLAGGIAHEANNQMTVVLGSASFLQKQLVEETARADVEHIRRAAQRTASITQQLLAFSRRQLLQPQIVDLNDTVNSLAAILRRALGETSRIELRLTTELGKVKADPGQLEQVLLNLALNARDAMPDGGVMTIETANVTMDGTHVGPNGLDPAMPGHYVLLAVSDTGRGMDRETLKHIFEPFFTTKGVGEGTGLGLATVYGIVKQSGGYVWAYSESGEGTAIKIYLPLFAAAGDVPAAEPARSPAGGREVILVAEDDHSVRSVLSRSLKEYGYTVLEAGDGLEALDIATRAAAPPDLVVADAIMPRMNGKGLWAELNRRWPSLPVLFISGYTGLDSVSRGLLVNGTDFMQKPLEPEVLAQKVREMLDARKRELPVG